MTLFLAFLVLAIYDAGCMTVLQLQHYGIYSSVGKENFRGYMRANNRAAALPTIVPAMLLLIISIILALRRPGFVRSDEAIIVVALNLVALISTFLWQRPIQAQMAATGYDEASIRRLVATNWIRTGAHWLIAALGVIILTRVARGS